MASGLSVVDSGLPEVLKRLRHFADRNPREAIALSFFFSLGTKQLLTTFLSRKKKEDPSDRYTVNYRKKSFTKTKGGPVNMGILAAMEFWVPVFVRGIEAYYMVKFGQEFYTRFKQNMPVDRLRKMTFGAFVLLPAFESLIPLDWSNPTLEQQRESQQFEKRFRYPLYLWTLLEVFTTVKVLGFLADPKSPFDFKNKLALAGVLGIFNGGVGINFSHELIHKSSKFEKVLGYTLLTNVNYLHWGSEHLYGHHKHVATPKDPATAKLNQSVYGFLPQTYIGSWKSSYDLEMDRLEKAGQSRYSLRNRILWYIAGPALYSFTLGKLFTKNVKQAMFFFYIQGAVAATLLEFVNYLEHYGLKREKLPNGSYEPVDPTHSWNAAHRLSNAVLIKLQRHSDHHTFASRPYHVLRNFEESPQLPAGYSGMISLALFPPAWFWVMNPLVKAHKENVNMVKAKQESDPKLPYYKGEKLIRAERVAHAKMTAFQLSVFLLAGRMMLKFQKF